MKPHPADETLALYAGGELGLWTRFRTAGHLGHCERCSRHVEEFRGVREFLDADRDTVPHTVEWSSLAAEMKANIRLGLAAGQCVAQPEYDRIRLPWRAPAVALPVLLVVVLGWILSVPRPDLLTPAQGAAVASGIVLDGGPASIGVEQDGRGLRIMHPRAAQNVVFSVGGESVNSRYVDADTGQVTISHVYAE